MNYMIKAILLSVASLLLVSCSNGNDKTAIIDPITGKHAAGWAVANTGGAHPAAFIAGSNVCFECHGTDLRGGTSKVSCYTASRSGITCHANGPGVQHAFPNPGSAHLSASNGTGCRSIGCHPADAAGSPYPVAAGIPPNCRACHLNNSPTVAPHCSDCHGSAANDAGTDLLAGRPVGGTAFPNIPGQHNNAFHPGFTCTACHPFTDTSASHGWSNRTKSIAAQVRILTSADIALGTLGITTWNPATGQCTASCHAGTPSPVRTW